MQAVYSGVTPMKDEEEKKQNWTGRATGLCCRSDSCERKGGGNGIGQGVSDKADLTKSKLTRQGTQH